MIQQVAHGIKPKAYHQLTSDLCPRQQSVLGDLKNQSFAEVKLVIFF